MCLFNKDAKLNQSEKMFLPKMLRQNKGVISLLLITIAIVTVLAVKPGLLGSKAIYKNGKFVIGDLLPARAVEQQQELAASEAPLPNLNNSDRTVFRTKAPFKDESGQIVQNLTGNSPWPVFKTGKAADDKVKLVPDNVPKTIGRTTAPRRGPVSANPTQHSNAQFDAYRNAVLINPRMIEDARDQSDTRAVHNRMGIQGGVYDTVTRILENAGAMPRPQDVIDCTGVPMLGLDTNHPCNNPIQAKLYAEDHLRIAYPVQA